MLLTLLRWNFEIKAHNLWSKVPLVLKSRIKNKFNNFLSKGSTDQMSYDSWVSKYIWWNNFRSSKMHTFLKWCPCFKIGESPGLTKFLAFNIKSPSSLLFGINKLDNFMSLFVSCSPLMVILLSHQFSYMCKDHGIS